MKLAGFLDIVFPKRCVSCGRLGKYFCNACTKMIQIILPNEAICPMCDRAALDGRTHPRCQTRYGLDGLTSFFHYEGVVKKSVKVIKYRLVSDIASAFVNLIYPSSFLSQWSHNILIPIPLHPSRLRERGFNQAEILGKFLADRLNIPMRTDILKRVKKTTPQVEIKKRDERLKNMANVFAAGQVSPEYVILFDDVFTTGATMRSAADVLKRTGARHVWAVTMAR